MMDQGNRNHPRSTGNPLLDLLHEEAERRQTDEAIIQAHATLTAAKDDPAVTNLDRIAASIALFNLNLYATARGCSITKFVC